MAARSTRYLIALLAAAFAPAQVFQSLEQAASRYGSDLTSGLRGPSGYRSSAGQHAAGFGRWACTICRCAISPITVLILRGEREQFRGAHAGRLDRGSWDDSKPRRYAAPGALIAGETSPRSRARAEKSLARRTLPRCAISDCWCAPRRPSASIGETSAVRRFSF